MTISRRSLLVMPLAATIAARDVIPAAEVIAAIERRHGGRLGIHAQDTGRTLAYRADERFKLYSTFKALLAGLVLADVAAGRERLDAPLRFTAADVISASPVTSAHVAEGVLSVRELCAAMMARSDNTAANLLMRRRGGPASLTRFIRGLGDEVTRVDSYEGALTGRPATFDSTTPRAMTSSTRTLLLGSALPEAERAQWERWMMGNEVGSARLRAAFPPGWTVGDRTGTGDGFCNDVAFARRPGRAPLLVSVYYDAPGMALPAQEAVLREVGQAVVAWQA